MNLQDLQNDFQQKVLDADCTGASWIKESPHGLSSKDRLAIYHNAYRVRLIDVLLDTFEHTAIYLGDEWFRQLAAAYMQSHHSTHNNIASRRNNTPIQFAAANSKGQARVSSPHAFKMRASG